MSSLLVVLLPFRKLCKVALGNSKHGQEFGLGQVCFPFTSIDSFGLPDFWVLELFKAQRGRRCLVRGCSGLFRHTAWGPFLFVFANVFAGCLTLVVFSWGNGL